MAKSSKRNVANGSSDNKNTKKKKLNKTGLEGVAMKEEVPKANINPFESIWSRKKFDILGQKRKGETKRMGLARSTAIEKRKKTLLKECEQSTKSSQFVDLRIGENDESIDDFGKAIMRLQRERQLNVKLSKKSKYQLSDGEDDDGFEGIDTLGGDDVTVMAHDDDDEPDDEAIPIHHEYAVKNRNLAENGTRSNSSKCGLHMHTLGCLWALLSEGED